MSKHTVAWICCAMCLGGNLGTAMAQDVSRSATRVPLRDTWPLSDTVIADPVPLSPSECESLGGTIKAHASCETTGTKCVVTTADGKEHHVCITEVKSK
jgi:hypothetical protein